MRIGLLTIGSRGDVEPVVALALGLARAGHEPTVATHEAFRPFVEERGLSFLPVVGDPQLMIRTPKVQALLASGRNPVAMLRGFADLLDDVWPDYVASTAAACEGQDAVVYTPLGFAAWHLGEALGFPTAMLALQPFGTTAEHLPASVLAGRSFGSLLNRTGHAVQQWLAWRLVAHHVDRWRTDDLGLESLGWRGLIRELERRREPIIHAYSPAIVPPPSDWPAWYPVTGWLYLDRRPDWTPPTDLVDFLAAGPVPVYAGFGSMVDTRAPHLTEAVVDALGRSDRRGVLAMGWGGLEPGRADDHLFVIEHVPHSWLLPQVSVAIHHGGAGTTGSVIRAGVPHVVVPVFGDQHFWARTVKARGLGSEADRRSLDRLGHALDAADRSDVRIRAQQLAEEVRAEDSVTRAVAAVEQWVAGRV